MSLALAFVLVACSQDKPAPTPPVKAPKPNQVEDKAPAQPTPASSAALPALPPAPALTPDNTFKTASTCVKAGYSQEQCSQAFTVAYAMFNVDAPVFKDTASCQTYFKKCEKADRGIVPHLAGFSVAGQEKGVVVKPSEKTPLFLLPLYETAQGKMAEIKIIASKPLLVPVGEQPTAQSVVLPTTAFKMPDPPKPQK